MRQLVPGLGEGVCELLGVLVEALRNRRVDWVQLQCEVGREHHGGVLLRRIVRVGHGAFRGCILGSPLLSTGRALRQLPVVVEQVVEVVVVPFGRVGRPCALRAARDGVVAAAGAVAVLPAEALLLETRALGRCADVFGIAGSAVAFAERVSAGNQRDGLLVVHRHASERLSNVLG